MNLNCKTFLIPVAVTLTLLFGMSAFAQGPADLTVANPAAATPAAALPANPVPQLGGVSANGESWRVGISIYGWFPATHGTVGVLGHDAGVSASFSDIFHTLKGIIPIAVEAQKGRFLVTGDYLWMRLGYDKGIPFNDLAQTSINLHTTESIFTPKLGYRVYDGEHLKMDVMGGIRYWYLSQSLTLQPSGLNFSRSANWVDGLGGARFLLPMGEKASVLISGDAGAGGANGSRFRRDWRSRR